MTHAAREYLAAHRASERAAKARDRLEAQLSPAELAEVRTRLSKEKA